AGRSAARTVSTAVRFRAFSDATLEAYVASGEGLDKAGSYGIQDLGAALVSEVHGSYTNVVGLPCAETIELLEQLGVLTAWP
ncbi:MAG TPA: Maf family protein, partial [Polyangiales bacterium]